MNITCSSCNVVGKKAQMIVSRHTGRAWCRDELACNRRKAKMYRSMNNAYEKGKSNEHMAR